MDMTISSMQPPQLPAFLPLQRGAAGSGFADSLRAQVRGEVAQAIADGLSGAPDGLGDGSVGLSNATNSTSASAGRYAALQQSIVGRATRPAATGPWADIARSVGAQYLSPQMAAIFTNQMAVESGNFDPDVISGKRVSSAGAEGIAQLMPSSYPNVNRTDPMASLNAAAQTMRDNLQRFGGDVRKALAAYNAGVGTVTDAIRRLGPNWENDLPAETRQYLAEIVGGARS
jgi:hypothetical protein